MLELSYNCCFILPWLTMHVLYIIVVDAMMCFLCDEECSNVKFLPCGHTVMCSKCAVRTKRCPQCQVSIKYSLPVAHLFYRMLKESIASRTRSQVWFH